MPSSDILKENDCIVPSDGQFADYDVEEHERDGNAEQLDEDKLASAHQGMTRSLLDACGNYVILRKRKRGKNDDAR